MAHWAKVKDGIVTQVIVAEEDFFNTFVDNTPGQWVQTSYNTRGGVHSDGGTPLRKNFAGEGYHYDGTGFYAPQPFPSWTLNSTSYLWEAPSEMPDDGNDYDWDEDTTSWVLAG